MRNINFKFLNFCTIYGSEGSIYKEKKREYCFSTIFYDGPNILRNKYTLEIYLDKHEEEYDNNCLLTTEQLVEHINEIKKLKPFEHTLEKHDNHYVLNFELIGPRVYHKIVLSWLRYTYEWPFNIALYEAFTLKNMKGFRRENLLNLFNLVGASMNYHKHGVDIHAIGKFEDFKKLVNYKTLKSLVVKSYKINPKTEINNIIPIVEDFHFKHIEHDKDFHKTSFWEKGFDKRFEIYKFNYNILKENK